MKFFRLHVCKQLFEDFINRNNNKINFAVKSSILLEKLGNVPKWLYKII